MIHYLKNAKLKSLSVIFALLLCFVFSNSLHGEIENPEPMQAAPAAPQVQRTSRLARFKAAARARLVKKLTNRDGKASKIIILPPVDYTSLQQPSLAIETIQKSISAYDPKIQVHMSEYRMDSLTLEHFRKAMIGNKADVLLTLIMHPTNFDIYLYDARTPYQIYAHSEPISSGAQYELTREAMQYYTKILVRRTLYRYIKNQYYELPREDSPTILKSEIPRHVASQESLEKINREAHANWYVTAGLGAALSSGASQSRWWNSSLLSGSFGRKVWKDIYLEANIDLSAYNIMGGSMKYVFVDKQKTFKTSLGVSGGYIMAQHTFNWDVNDDIRSGTIIAGVNGTVLLPVGDIYLKAEGRVYFGINRSAIILNILPGLFFVF